MNPDTPTPPKCIAEALHHKLGEYSSGETYRREMLHYEDVAQAVWDAVLAEGHIRYAVGRPEELGRWIVPTFDTSNHHADDWCAVLVLPLAGLGGDPQTGNADATRYGHMWECPDGLRAKANCYAECQRRDLPPCLSCMESLA